MSESELVFRHKLGIPDDAERVLVFGESSHWDPNWLRTSEQYYRHFVEHNLDFALEALAREPRRIYSVECMFFLRLYWERRPDQRERVRELVNEGRLRLTSSGVTTADTLLPSSESILRDLLAGQEWLRRNGMTQEPTLAYFVDSFGCTPALPSLLRAAGFDRAALSRIDGVHFPGATLEPASHYPLRGSSAARLLQIEKSVDLVWRDMNGAEVLTHWNAFTYGQGDLLAHLGIGRVYLVPMAVSFRSERHIARRVQQYVRQLEPYSRTPYLFCPIGYDFVAPIQDLVGLLDRYNRVRYPSTGVWVVNAGLDDYLSLVDYHRQYLPVVELDPNPYWTGFYTSRPALKQQCRLLVDRLLLAEQLATLSSCSNDGSEIVEELEPAWWDAVTANHHDFITGTSPDIVVEAEQRPWLARSTEIVEKVITRLANRIPATELPQATATRELPGWSRQGDRLLIESPSYVVEMSEEAGGDIVRAWEPGLAGQPRRPQGEAWLVDLSNELISYSGTGGLWRMGHEFRGGRFRVGQRASHEHVPLQVRELPDRLQVTCAIDFDGEIIRRTLWFQHDSPLIYGRVEGRAARRRTLSLLFATDVVTDQLAMGQPGGVVVRPWHRIYSPTFWPVQEFVHINHPVENRGLALFFRGPTAVAYHEDGRLEVVALRNATREWAYRFIPLLANMASGYERLPYAFDYALLPTAGGDWQANRLDRLAQDLAAGPWREGNRAGLYAYTASKVRVEGLDESQPGVAVMAAKPASRGKGLIVRFYAHAVPADRLAISLVDCSITAAFRCDARERDLEPLPMQDGRVVMTMRGTVATLRLLVAAQQGG
jgi:hypothetical protein